MRGDAIKEFRYLILYEYYWRARYEKVMAHDKKKIVEIRKIKYKPEPMNQLILIYLFSFL